LNNTNGTPETDGKLTPEDLRRYHTKLMETSRLLLVIVGDLNPAEVKELVTASFGKLPRGSYKAEAVPALAFDKSSVDVTPRELPTNYIQGLFTAPSLTSPDIYAMRIASSSVCAIVCLRKCARSETSRMRRMRFCGRRLRYVGGFT
jgi:predicted Zn-dependent peptidase